jgi:glycosyltransferase involved in cell wall biosynthesis
MRIALDLGPVTVHQNRGIGVYTKSLKDALGDKVTSFAGKIPADCDLVHFPGFNLFKPDWRFLTQKPFVVTVHDVIPLMFPRQFPLGLKAKFILSVQRLLLSRARMIITDSNASRKQLIEKLAIKPAKIKVIYLAARKEFRPGPAPKLKLPEKFILYVGDVNYNKNLPLLAKTCLELGKPLVVVGKAAKASGYDREHPENQDLVKLQALAESNPSLIIRLGAVSANDLPGIYCAATVYAQPSLAEGFGLPVLEAMASGTPVITSKGTATEEIAGKGLPAGRQAALLINPKDVDQLKKALRRMLSDPALRSRLSQLGLIQARKFSWEKTAQETSKVYETILQTN